MVDVPEIPKKGVRTQAELIVQMTKEAQRVERRTGAKSCIVICFFEENGQIRVQDAGRFPMPPDQFYEVMIRAHSQGKFGEANAPKKSRIIKPH